MIPMLFTDGDIAWKGGCCWLVLMWMVSMTGPPEGLSWFSRFRMLSLMLWNPDKMLSFSRPLAPPLGFWLRLLLTLDR